MISRICNLSLILIFIVMTGCEQTAPLSAQKEEPTAENEETRAFCKLRHDKFTVMTRNVYVGADVDAVLAAEDPSEIPILAAEAFQMLKFTDFHERAVSLANEISWNNPHLIGLQEISTIRLQIPGDAMATPIPNAQDVAYDYLEILLQTLADKGLKYYVAGIVENVDVEVPMVVGFDENENPQFGDVRLTDYDVVLARGDVFVSDVVEKNFQLKLTFDDLGVEIPRGYISLIASYGKKKVRFVNTHLEALSGDPQTDELLVQLQAGQAMELMAELQDETLPIILVGDFNSPAPYAITYQSIIDAGFIDLWEINRFDYKGDGNTYGHDLDLRNRRVNFYERIDFIFAKNLMSSKQNRRFPVWAMVVGDEYRNRTISRLWPSDHGGVVASFYLPGMEQYINKYTW